MSAQKLQAPPMNESGTVSWIHIGDTHITRAGEQNEVDLGNIIDEINEVYARTGIDFVFLPGDIADNGSATAYRIVRAHLDRLTIPWIAIVGDHDVHERSFANFRSYISCELYSAFTIGAYRFFRLNAFSEPRPDSFAINGEQLDWLATELQGCVTQNKQAVLLLHCYPSELKQGTARLTDLLSQYPVLLIDMGHTHYNEISNDGRVLYSATRSTGQVEEGPVGYSVLTLDDSAVSWHFVRLGSPSLVAITHPVDRRLSTTRTSRPARSSKIQVRVKTWSRQPVIAVTAELEGKNIDLWSKDGLLWQGEFESPAWNNGTHRLLVTANNTLGAPFSNDIWLTIGPLPQPERSSIDQQNAIGAWIEREILGTQLGPNKNGRKW